MPAAPPWVHRVLAVLVALLTAVAVAACSPAPTEESGETAGRGVPVAGTEPAVVRVALFNVRELSADKIADVDTAGVGRDPQLRAAAGIIQRVRPDVLVVQEIDGPTAAADPDPARHARRFADAYLATGVDPVDYPHVYVAPVNTGVLSGYDLDGDGLAASREQLGTRAYGNDCWGWGTYPGQYGMAVLSRLPLAVEEARTFRGFRWRDLPGHHLPAAFYPPAAVEEMPLPSKSHWDLPVRVGEGDGGGRRLHLWISHPTPPVFDGEEDRNGRRNFDEIRFWKLYLEGSDALVDDAGRRGGYGAGEPFVVVGDLNADPRSPEAVYDGVQAIGQLLGHPGLRDAGDLLTSEGAAGLERIGGGPPERATAAFEPAMRLDHLVPSTGLTAVDGGVFWPDAASDPEGHRLAETASDHRLVWLDLEL